MSTDWCSESPANTGSPDGGLVVVTTIIGQGDSEATYDSIYGRERALIRGFRPRHLDFNVVARRGRPVDALLDPDAPT